jgi:glyoxylase-like metal-dependent hydrolase (beta-lactamase superfamily II)
MAAFDRVRILLTHGHGDHAGAVQALVGLTDAEVLAPEGIEAYGVPTPDRVVGDGDTIGTDAGPLTAIRTPGHTPEHLCFLWPAQRALFVGDLMLGHGDTTWVAEYPGCVADYLASLERLRSLDLDVLYPAHGPPLLDPSEAIDRYEAHRRRRIEQVVGALERAPGADAEELVTLVYGDGLPNDLRRAATRSLAALLEYVREAGGGLPGAAAR